MMPIPSPAASSKINDAYEELNIDTYTDNQQQQPSDAAAAAAADDDDTVAATDDGHIEYEPVNTYVPLIDSPQRSPTYEVPDCQHHSDDNCDH